MRETQESFEGEFFFLSPPIETGDLASLGPYRILNLVGRGGMGVVFRAIDPKLQRIVAIKVLAPEIAVDPMARRRFEREARSAAAVSHPHVVVIHAVEESHDPPYLVMEYVQGKTLADKLAKQGALSVKEILRIGSQMAEGLAAAHQQGLVHRDMKPANILLENGVERAKVADFGLAKTVDDLSMTRTGDWSGTPQFMSPEQASGGLVDHRSDLFSMGAILYMMCTGRPPFRADNPLALLKRVCESTPRPVQQINRDIPNWLSDIVDRLLSKSAANRYQTAAEVAGLLQKHLAFVQAGTHVIQSKPQSALDRRPIWLLSILATILALGVCVLVWPSSHPMPHDSLSSATRMGDMPSPIGTDARSATSKITPTTVLSPNEAVTVKHAEPGLAKTSERPDPFDATKAEDRPEQADSLNGDVRLAQQTWAKYLGRDVEVEVEIAKGVTMTFVLVPPGQFLMGSPQNEQGRAENELQHLVRLTEPFDISKYEVTQIQYAALTGRDPSWHKGLDRPVEQVAWDEAEAYGRDLTNRLSDRHVYRLPTEAEWEYSCRGGHLSSQPFGIGDGRTLNLGDANFNNSLRRTCKVGSYVANALGLCDMHGNVWEWCADWNEPYLNGAVTNPLRTEGGPYRVARGGCWNEPAEGCRSALRQGSPEQRRDGYMGFRLARSVPSAAKSG